MSHRYTHWLVWSLALTAAAFGCEEDQRSVLTQSGDAIAEALPGCSGPFVLSTVLVNDANSEPDAMEDLYRRLSCSTGKFIPHSAPADQPEHSVIDK